MAEGLENYASPILRAAVYLRLHPGAEITYNIVPIGEAFPPGHREYEGKATEAVECTIINPDGSWVQAYKECDLVERGKPVLQTPENLAKDQTKALGRALRDAGIPQKMSELQTLMRWIVALSPQTVQTAGLQDQPQQVDTTTGEIMHGASQDVDDPDAGNGDSLLELLQGRIAQLTPTEKVAVAKKARDEHGVANLMRPPDDKITEIHQVIDEMISAERPNHES